MNKLRKQEQEYRHRDRKEHDTNTQVQIKELRAEILSMREHILKVEMEASQEKSKLTFDCEDAKYRMKHAESQLKQAQAERAQAIEYAERLREQEIEIPLNLKTIGEQRKKIQHLEISLAKERKEGGLLESLQAIKEENIAASTLMTFLSFIFSRQDQIDKHRFEYLREMFEKSQYKLIEAYETKLGSIMQMNGALLT